jgi:hypothetical protein
MKTFLSALLLSGIVFLHQHAIAQVGIGTTTPNAKAVLDLRSPGNNQGFLVPRLTTAQRNAMAGLSDQDNGLLVYDTNDQKFYYWQTSQWLPLRSGNDVVITAGAGITVTDNTIAAADASATNEIQDLQLQGSTLKITDNTSATGINLAQYLGTNTDEQQLAFNVTSGVLSISNGNSVTITAAPTGAAGGDLTGTYPNPAIANNAITAGKIAPATANGQVLTTVGGVTQWANPAPPTGAAGGDLTGTFPNPTIAGNAVTVGKIAPATANGQVLTTVGGVTQWSNLPGAPPLSSVLASGNNAGGREITGLSAVSINWGKDDPASGALNVRGAQFVGFTVVSDNYAVDKADYLIITKLTSKPMEIRLPKASENPGRLIIIRSVARGQSDAVTVSSQSPELIDGYGSSEPLYYAPDKAYSITVISDGTTWLTINRAIAPAAK